MIRLELRQHPIRAVQVSADRGQSWQPATCHFEPRKHDQLKKSHFADQRHSVHLRLKFPKMTAKVHVGAEGSDHETLAISLCVRRSRVPVLPEASHFREKCV